MTELTREEWLARRRSGIGGSDVAAVLGLSPWKSPRQVWLDKTTDAVDDAVDEDLLAGMDGGVPDGPSATEDVVVDDLPQRPADGGLVDDEHVNRRRCRGRRR